MKRCKHCREYAKNGVQHPAGWFCSHDHAIEYAIAQRAKQAAKRRNKQKREDRQKLEQMKTASDLTKEAQKDFNRWIRLRDHHKPCVSCGDPSPPQIVGGQWDAGHYLSVGSHPELRFNDDNCHKQCKSCNSGAGKYQRKKRSVDDAYRAELIRRIGLERVEALENRRYEPGKWSADELRAMRDDYRKRCRELEKAITDSA